MNCMAESQRTPTSDHSSGVVAVCVNSAAIVAVRTASPKGSGLAVGVCGSVSSVVSAGVLTVGSDEGLSKNFQARNPVNASKAATKKILKDLDITL